MTILGIKVFKEKPRAKIISDKADGLLMKITNDDDDFTPVEQAMIINKLIDRFKETKRDEKQNLIKSQKEINEALKLLL